MTLHKKDYKAELQLQVNAIASEHRRIRFSFDSLNLVSGDYHMKLTGYSVGGIRSEWDLGHIQVWFREGQL